MQTAFAFEPQAPRRLKKQHLVFALMPDEAGAAAVARFTTRILRDEDGATPVKQTRLYMALATLTPARPGSAAVMYGAKLAGQAVPAAGLKLIFDGIGTAYGGAGYGALALTSSGSPLRGVIAALQTALAKNGLAADFAAPQLVIADGAARMPQQAMPPLAVTISGLALLRVAGEGDFSVLRRWPLNLARLAPPQPAPLDSVPVPPREAAMAITVFGIKNCDTMKKAFTWLDDHGVAYAFHDYKKAPPTKAQLTKWCRALGWEKVLNRAGPSFRKLPDADKADLNQTKAIELMLKNPSMIKRPLVECGDAYELGFKPENFAAFFGK